MAFNVLDTVFFLLFYQYFSIDTVYQDKIMKENQANHHLHLTSSYPIPSDTSQSFRFFRKIIDMIEYNRFSYSKFLLFFVHLIVLLIALGITTTFMLFPRVRHSTTGELLNPFIRLVESYNLTDIFKHYKSALEMNRALFFILCSSLVTKLLCFRRHLIRAEKNKYHYKKINSIQISINYLASLYYNAKEWYYLSLSWFNHDCKIGYVLQTNASGPSVELLANADQRNKIYYNNPIDFSSCFHELYTRYSYCNTLIRQQSLFVPEPRHRVCIRTISFILLQATFCTVFFSLLNISLIVIFFQNRSDQHNQSSQSNTKQLDTSYIVESVTIAALLTMDNTQSLVCFWSGLFCYSRIIAVSNLIKNEVDYQQNISRQFLRQLAIKETQFSVAFYMDPFILSDQHLRKLAKEYRNQINERELRDRQASLNYIIFLVQVLIKELEDAKETFTSSINLMFSFGVFGATILFSVFSRAQDGMEIIYAVVLLVSSTLPLLFCGYQSALIEWAFCRLCKLLFYLMADEFDLMDTETSINLNKILNHITDVKNRAFVLFTDIALTFQSIFTILGWIANIYPLLISSGFIT